MEKQNPSCIDWGTLFSTPFDVQRHIKRGCPMDENAPEPKRIRYDEDIDEDNDNQSLFLFKTSEVAFSKEYAFFSTKFCI
jgi:hypothetical protein